MNTLLIHTGQGVLQCTFTRSIVGVYQDPNPKAVAMLVTWKSQRLMFGATSSHRMYLLISFRRSTHPPRGQPVYGVRWWLTAELR